MIETLKTLPIPVTSPEETKLYCSNAPLIVKFCQTMRCQLLSNFQADLNLLRDGELTQPLASGENYARCPFFLEVINNPTCSKLKPVQIKPDSKIIALRRRG